MHIPRRLRLQPESRFARHLAAVLVVAVLGACTSVSTPGPAGTPAAGEWATQQKHLRKLQQWTAIGKIALRSPEASESASLQWRQNEEHSQLKLNGPLGMGSTLISGNGKTLVVEQGGTLRTVDISTPEAIFTNTGWKLPLKAMPYWLKGLPSPDYPVDELTVTASGLNVERLRQDGWQITYEQYRVFDTLSLPTRLVAERGDVRLKVIVRNWRDLSG